MHRAALLAAALLILRGPARAWACSSCAKPVDGGGAATRAAYYLTTGAMTLLPVLLVLTIAIWIRRQRRRQ